MIYKIIKLLFRIFGTRVYLNTYICANICILIYTTIYKFRNVCIYSHLDNKKKIILEKCLKICFEEAS